MTPKRFKIFLVTVRSFVHLHDSYVFKQVVYERHITSSHNPQSGILLSVQYLSTSPHDPTTFFFFSYQVIYKCKLVMSPPVDPYAFIHSAKCLFTPGGSVDHFKKTYRNHQYY